MGEVYRATDSVLERPVAVKVLSQRYAEEPDARARFEREALAAARLSRERHVVTVFDVGEHYGRPLIVMEYVDGGSVHDRLEQGPVSREQALDWLEQVAQALDRAHANGIVHRDVKPANLLLDAEGAVRVSDFGIASAAGLETVTLPGTVLGTAGYLSPEQARGEPATPASDRYALGVIAFELLTGRRPFAGDTAATEAFAHVTAAVPSAAQLQPELSRDIDDVLARSLAKDPADRPASCAELVADLREAVGNVDVRPFDPSAPTEVAELRQPVRHEPATTRVLVGDSRRPPWHRAGRVVAALGPALPRMRSSARRALERTRSSARHALEQPARGPRSAAAVSAVAILLGGITGFALLGFGNDESGADAPGVRSPAASAAEEAQAPPQIDGVALNARGFELMQAGRYEDALPVLRRAVGALLGWKTLDEAYASYNLAFTRFALGHCNGVVGLLDRSERIQGRRSAIDRLRADWDIRCGAPDDDGVEVDEVRGNPGKGKAKGRGRGRGGDD